MAKNRYSKMQGNMQYNRPSGGYQKNLYRQQMLANNVKQPKTMNQKTVRTITIVIGVAWIALTIVLGILFKWKGMLIGFGVGFVAMAIFWFYLQHLQKELIKYYKQIGMTEEMYLNEIKKRNPDVKQLRAASKSWRKVQAEPIIENPKAKKKK